MSNKTQISHQSLVILIPDAYSPSNYPGVYQKYCEIATVFQERGYLVKIVGYDSSIHSLWKLRYQSELKNANIIWLRSPGIRLWLITIVLRTFSIQTRLLLEFPSPFTTYFRGGNRILFSKSGVKTWVESYLSILIFLLRLSRFEWIIEYGNERPALTYLFNLKDRGLLLGNPVPRSIVMATRIYVTANKNRAALSSARKARTSFIIIANLEPWHGIDRILSGFATYTLNQDAPRPLLKVVGSVRRDYHESLCRLADDLGVRDCIEFYSQQDPLQLSSTMEEVDIGISALGTHRRGYRVASPLKSGLYVASGLPFICSCTDVRFERDFPYRFQCPADESPIDIHSILVWYESLDLSRAGQKMHEYFQREMNTDKLLSPVFDRLNIPSLT